MSSNNAAAEQEAFIGEKKEKKSRMQSFMNFFYDKEAGTFMGRTGKSWLKITTFYLIFYACLAGFFAICLAVFMSTVSNDRPKCMGDKHIIGSRPGLGYQPWLLDEPDSTLIKFKVNEKVEKDDDGKVKPKSWEKYVNQLRRFLAGYYDRNEKGDKYDNKIERSIVPKCNGTTTETTCPYKETISEALAKFRVKDRDGNTPDDFSTFKSMNDSLFGYGEEGRPVVMLTLNRLIDWMPNTFSEAEIADQGALSEDDQEKLNGLKKSDKERFANDHVLIACNGQYKADQDNIGPVDYSPDGGIPKNYFPFRKFKDYPRQQKYGYDQPIAFVQFKGITRNVLVMVECKAYAKNVAIDRYYKLGIAHFELIVDDGEKDDK